MQKNDLKIIIYNIYKINMPYIIIIEKNGELKEHNIKDTKFNEETLYKKIGLKNNNNFQCIYNQNNIRLYGKTKGKYFYF